jgi:hypothetical protein
VPWFQSFRDRNFEARQVRWEGEGVNCELGRKGRKWEGEQEVGEREGKWKVETPWVQVL